MITHTHTHTHTQQLILLKGTISLKLCTNDYTATVYLLKDMFLVSKNLLNNLATLRCIWWQWAW